MTTSGFTGGKHYFPNLDGFRLLAFLLVFLNHGFYTLPNFTQEGTVLHYISNALIRNGGAGVSFFFVLSGFLITYLLVEETRHFGSINIMKFYGRRVLRIWPLYYLTLLIFIAFQLGKFQTGFDTSLIEDKMSLAYFVFLSNFKFIEKIHSLTQVDLGVDITWSVAIEEQFYLFWPLILLIKNSRVQFILTLSVFLGAIYFRITVRNDLATINYHTLSAFYELSLGGIIAILSFSDKFIQFIKTLPRYSIKIGYFLGVCYIFINGDLHLFNDAKLILPLFYAFVILEQNFAENSFYKMKNFNALSKRSKYTYSMYLLHPLALNLVTIPLVILKINLSSLWSSVFIGSLGFLLTLTISYFSYHYFEKFFLRYKKHIKAI